MHCYVEPGKGNGKLIVPLSLLSLIRSTVTHPLSVIAPSTHSAEIDNCLPSLTHGAKLYDFLTIRATLYIMQADHNKPLFVYIREKMNKT